MLEGAEIPFLVLNENNGLGAGYHPLDAYTEFRVPAELLEEAREILAPVLEESPEELPEE